MYQLTEEDNVSHVLSFNSNTRTRSYGTQRRKTDGRDLSSYVVLQIFQVFMLIYWCRLFLLDIPKDSCPDHLGLVILVARWEQHGWRWCYYQPFIAAHPWFHWLCGKLLHRVETTVRDECVDEQQQVLRMYWTCVDIFFHWLFLQNLLHFQRSMS